MIRYSLNNWVYSGDDMPIFERVARFGYDDVELIGAPAQAII